MANRPHHHAIAPKSLRKPTPSYHVKTGRNGISGTADWLLTAFKDVSSKKSSYGSSIAVLDGIRGLAVIIVLASHTNSFGMWAQGSLGVMLFFFLSGYVLSVPFSNETKKILDISTLKRFTINRLLRIVPIYWIIVAFTALFLNRNIEWYLWNIFFIKGWNHFWSVAQEIRFYILFPIIIGIVSFFNNKFIKIIILALLIFISYKYKYMHKIDMMVGRHVNFYIFMFLGGAFTCFSVDLFPESVKINQ
jgi:peptidoglycan/LPS O-acetylase OafA/YrhL